MTKPLKEKEFMLTDCCMWEKNMLEGTRAPHSVEVVDVETGQVRYIRSGSKIRLIEGQISPENTQEEYNEQQKETEDVA